MKGSGGGDPVVIDEFDGGVGWIAYPDETMERASHALSVDGDVWVLDPVDGDGVDDLIADLEGDVAGVVVCLDRHKRDAAAIATRHDVPVYVPDWMTGVATKLDAPVERFGRELGGLRAITIRDSSIPPWQEVGLLDEDGGTLYVPESVGTSSYMRTGGETLGVHPMLRLFPPRRALSGLSPERVLCGHGAGVTEGGARALADALDSSRGNAPGLYVKALGSVLG
ncbi:hypothetical protein Hbl1158_06915 [Halobaculum sp. CBA1158]|uniref:hypothetical protein n=1 Tax=Halobaculum sp. CBA1158 TaxID=2904243 RepID=UPI001F3697A4|nr:hypothetical protein [Halobaculum sp. CBA1158]UIP01245.1 hypothetical protein Hbl1158_06915 [Halobaculum sp. CBA1158]